VLVQEGRAVDLSFAFVGVARIRELNRRWRGADRPTDVLAFPLEQPGGALTGDVYICRTVAEREAAARKLPLREELLRLVVHGTLHVLGYDHPEGTGRTRSSMWRRQERYLACLR
jgi:probable rRNA maturation factor